jgi:RNA polymerase sigma factor (sigma-70 family)
MTTPQDIEALLARVALRDRAAFEALYDATSARLMAVALSILKTRPAAEDAMQDSFVKVWTHAGRYQANGLSPMTWLITIVRNSAIDRLRRQKGDGSDIGELEAVLASADPGPERHAIAASDAARLRACFDELPEDRAGAIRGAYLEGRSYAELAETFDTPLNTMRTWLRRGLAALRECMSDD